MSTIFLRTILRPGYKFLIIAFAILLSACGNSSTATNSGLTVKIIPAPEGRTGTYLFVQVADKENQPVSDAKVGLEGNMTHAGMVPILADGVTDDADGTQDGSYQLPFEFSMAGDWVITVVVERAGKVETYDVNVSVNDTTVTLE